MSILAFSSFIQIPNAPVYLGQPIVQGHIRIINFNAWGSNRTPDQTETFLLEMSPDILALQEVFGVSYELADQMKNHLPHETQCAGSSTRLLSRFPILDSGCLPQDDPTWRTLSGRTNLPFPSVWADIETPQGNVRVTAVHFDWPAILGDHTGQREILAEHVRRHGDAPQIVLGDFNTSEPSHIMAAVDQSLSDLTRITSGHRTWPSRSVSMIPLIGIDHIYVSDELVYQYQGTSADGGSDHRAIIADVKLPMALPATVPSP